MYRSSLRGEQTMDMDWVVLRLWKAIKLIEEAKQMTAELGQSEVLARIAEGEKLLIRGLALGYETWRPASEKDGPQDVP